MFTVCVGFLDAPSTPLYNYDDYIIVSEDGTIIQDLPTIPAEEPDIELLPSESCASDHDFRTPLVDICGTDTEDTEVVDICEEQEPLSVSQEALSQVKEVSSRLITGRNRRYDFWLWCVMCVCFSFSICFSLVGGVGWIAAPC